MHEQDLHGSDDIDAGAGVGGEDHRGHGQMPRVLGGVLVSGCVDQPAAAHDRLQLVDLQEEVETAGEVGVDGGGQLDDLGCIRSTQPKGPSG